MRLKEIMMLLGIIWGVTFGSVLAVSPLVGIYLSNMSEMLLNIVVGDSILSGEMIVISIADNWYRKKKGE